MRAASQPCFPRRAAAPASVCRTAHEVHAPGNAPRRSERKRRRRFSAPEDRHVIGNSFTPLFLHYRPPDRAHHIPFIIPALQRPLHVVNGRSPVHAFHGKLRYPVRREGSRKTTALNQLGERVAGHPGTTVQLEKQFGGNPVRSRLSIQARPSVCGHLHHLQQARHGRLFPFRRRKALPYRPPQATGAFFQAGLRAVQKVPRQSRPGPFQPSALPCPFRTGGKSANNVSSSIIRAARGYSGHR